MGARIGHGRDFGGIVYQAFGKGQAAAFRHHQVLHGEVWIQPVLAKLGIRRTVAPLVRHPQVSVGLESCGNRLG